MPSSDTADSIATNIVEIDWFDDGDVVRVTPRDQARFEVQKDHAINVLRVAAKQGAFTNQFNLLLQQLARWITSQKDKLARSIITLQDGSLVFLVMTKSVAYDEDFQDALSELELEIANDCDLNLIELSTFAVPSVSRDSLNSFIDQRMVLEYGKRA